jgi:hypothetical protein
VNDACEFFAAWVWGVVAGEQEGLLSEESADRLLLEKARGLAAAYAIDREVRAKARLDELIQVVS